jgi:hypothetical protein
MSLILEDPGMTFYNLDCVKTVFMPMTVARHEGLWGWVRKMRYVLEVL